MDKIFLKDLRVETVIGIWEWERRIKQTVSLDLELATDVQKAAASDSIDDALDYKGIAKRLVRAVEESEFRLVETLAETLARIVVTEFGVAWVKLSVSKPGAIEGSRDVGVVIEREAGDYA
jgi:dihydroneopterin aldolase